jgi:putative CocE/NonD family hydrolase
MRDGIQLSADIYLPARSERKPVVLARTPYNKNTELAVRKATQMVEQGFVFVWMDVRGRGDSDGEFVPYRNDAADGYDSIEWAAGQEWSAGAVATWGPSYLGWIQWLTALTQPPHLKAMVVYVCPSDPFTDWPGGTQLPQYVCWFRLVDGRVLQHVEAIDWMSVYEHLPLESMDEAAGFRSEHWRRDLAHAPCHPYWDPLRYQQRLGELDLPVLHVTGWYDDCQQASLNNFAMLRASARSEAARSGQRLIVGPWDHTLTRTRARQLGAIDFGESADLDLDGYEAAWLRHHLLETPLPAALAAPAQLFVMGRNEWRNETNWPLERTEWTRFYLTSGGSANTRFGDGALTQRPAESAEAMDEFVYDPADPVPFLTAPLSSQIGGPDDYSAVEERADVLVYSTGVLDADLEVTGPILLHLFASSSAADTDFAAKLIDVHPDGYCQRLCDGMTRARFRNGFQEEFLLERGEIAEFSVDLWNISHVFFKGHRLRLEVASSAFPKYDRNLNTGGALASSTAMAVARNAVWHTAEYSSHLVLPVILPAPPTNPVRNSAT